MELSNSSLISRLSESYADGICSVKSGKPLSRGSIAAAYIVGASAAINRICLLIEASAKAEKGLTQKQAQKLIGLIELTENLTDGN